MVHFENNFVRWKNRRAIAKRVRQVLKLMRANYLNRLRRAHISDATTTTK